MLEVPLGEDVRELPDLKPSFGRWSAVDQPTLLLLESPQVEVELQDVLKMWLRGNTLSILQLIDFVVPDTISVSHDKDVARWQGYFELTLNFHIVPEGLTLKLESLNHSVEDDSSAEEQDNLIWYFVWRLSRKLRVVVILPADATPRQHAWAVNPDLNRIGVYAKIPPTKLICEQLLQHFLIPPILVESSWQGFYPHHPGGPVNEPPGRWGFNPSGFLFSTSRAFSL